MLPKARRIDRRLFNDVFARGAFFNGDYLSGKIISLDDNLPTRFACVVSKKVAAKAVDRNLLRRRLYSALSLLLKNVKPGSAIIVLAKPNTLDLDVPALHTIFTNLLKHYKIYHD